jgi:hypothetical protein
VTAQELVVGGVYRVDWRGTSRLLELTELRIDSTGGIDVMFQDLKMKRLYIGLVLHFSGGAWLDPADDLLKKAGYPAPTISVSPIAMGEGPDS